MLRLALLSLIVICCAQHSVACGPCSTAQSCRGSCCTWDNPEIDNNPASYNDPKAYPLGFVTAIFPRLESMKDSPCAIFTIPVNNQSTQNYIQVSVESVNAAEVCVYETSKPDSQDCGTEVFFCNPDGYVNIQSIEFTFDCKDCASEANIYYRFDLESLESVDEHWCGNTNKTLPRDLLQVPVPTTDIATPTRFTDGAPRLSLSLPFLAASVIITSLSRVSM